MVPGLMLGTAATSFWFFDGPISNYALNHSHKGLLGEFLALAEPFGNGLSVAVIAILIYRLDLERRRYLPRFLCMVAGAAMAANTMKLCVARWRPLTDEWDPANPLRSLAEWWPLFDSPSAAQSFPSAHTATAVGLAIALCWLYPRGRLVFVAAPVFVALQRIAWGSHFASDVCVGAAAGWIVADSLLRSNIAARVFARWETRPWLDEQTRVERVPPVDEPPSVIVPHRRCADRVPPAQTDHSGLRKRAA